MTTRIGVGFSGGLPPADIVECVRLADDLGYESAWVAEGHGGDQFAILAACAVSTRRIRLGTSISSVFVRSAPTIGMAAATVDHLSGGRFVLGLGSSHRVQVEPEHGIPFVQPTQRLRETVDLVRALVRDGVVAYAGKALDVKSFDLWFKPRGRRSRSTSRRCFRPADRRDHRRRRPGNRTLTRTSLARAAPALALVCLLPSRSAAPARSPGHEGKVVASSWGSEPPGRSSHPHPPPQGLVVVGRKYRRF